MKLHKLSLIWINPNNWSVEKLTSHRQCGIVLSTDYKTNNSIPQSYDIGYSSITSTLTKLPIYNYCIKGSL